MATAGLQQLQPEACIETDITTLLQLNGKGRLVTSAKYLVNFTNFNPPFRTAFSSLLLL